jgi:hypothetical protein
MAMCGLISEVLGLPEVGFDDSFVGTRCSPPRVISRVRTTCLQRPDLCLKG